MCNRRKESHRSGWEAYELIEFNANLSFRRLIHNDRIYRDARERLSFPCILNDFYELQMLNIPIHCIILSLSQPFCTPSIHANNLWLSYSLLNNLCIYQWMYEAACMCVCAYRLLGAYGGFDKKWNQQFLFQQQDPADSPREGSIVQNFHHNTAIWRTEGSATGSLPEQRQTAIHICIEVVI